MDDQLDNELKKRIKEVFENFEDTSADEGWLLLREKYPEKNKRIIAAWLYWAPAAALLLFFLGILWFKIPPKQQQVAITKTQPGHPAIKPAEGKKKDNISSDSSALQQSKQGIANNTPKHVAAPENTPRKLNPVTHTDKEQQSYALNTQKNIPVPVSKTPVARSNVDNSASINTRSHTKTQNQDAYPEKAGLAAVATRQNPVLTPANPTQTINSKIDSGANSPLKPNSANVVPNVNMLAQQPARANTQLFADNDNSYKNKNHRQKVNLSVSLYTPLLTSTMRKGVTTSLTLAQALPLILK